MKKIQIRHIIYLVPEKIGTRYIFGIFGKEKMKDTVKQAFIATIPVLAGYLALGFGFGVLLSAGGYGVFHALIMSVFIYAGTGQYIGVGLLTSGASLITVAVTTFMVNARHIFYGVSLLDKYKGAGLRKIYMIFALTDETYSLAVSDNPRIPKGHEKDYYFLISLFDHLWWISGCVLGAAVGTLVHFNSEGIDFVLTALFVTIVVEQWITNKDHLPAIIGALSSVICLVIFGADNFLIPAMLVIALLLSLRKEADANG